jgi:hypothetical protein
MKEDAFSDAIKESFVLLKVLIDAFKERMSHHVVQIKVRFMLHCVCYYFIRITSWINKLSRKHEKLWFTLDLVYEQVSLNSQEVF